MSYQCHTEVFFFFFQANPKDKVQQNSQQFYQDFPIHIIPPQRVNSQVDYGSIKDKYGENDRNGQMTLLAEWNYFSRIDFKRSFWGQKNKQNPNISYLGLVCLHA